MFALLLITALAHSAPVSAVLTGGFVANDPFVERRGVAIGVEWRAAPWVGLTADLGGYPNLGAGDHTALTRSLIDEVNSGPVVSRTTVRAELGARWLPIQRPIGGTISGLGVVTGVGLSRTVDEDLGGDAALDAPVQVLPTARVGLDAEVRARVWGVRAGVATVVRRERITNAPQTRTELWVSAALTFTPKARQTDIAETLDPTPSR